MKNETFIPTDEIVNKLYEDFCLDTSILSMSALRRKHGYGSKSGRKIQLAIYAKYGEAAVKLEANRRLGKYRASKVTGTYRPSAETLQKRRESQKRTYQSRPDLQMIARLNGLRSRGRIQSDDEKRRRAISNTGKKRTEQTRRNISNGQPNKGKPLPDWHKKALRVPKSRYVVYERTDETRKKLSNICKQQWRTGVHKATYISKGQREMNETLQQLGYKTQLEKIVDGRPFDVWIVDSKLLFEFNGTFWHRDPRKYKKTDGMVEEVWQRDVEKRKIGEKNGYTVVTVWQMDWEKCMDKSGMLCQILKSHGY